ncbi:MAG: ABC transporter permease subunit [Lachnospiraceae bacterium]|nr:ABC transporter permease subunit [Lachnospiraceae bacterium]
MSAWLEYKKVKRTGFIPLFLIGGILSAAVPVTNMVFRAEMYIGMSGTPVQILLGANWQLMAMFNVLVIVTGTCLLYHIEYDNNSIQKLKSLPIHEGQVFLGKAVLVVMMYLVALVTEAAAVIFCSIHWFVTGDGFWTELCQNFVYMFIIGLPCIALSLMVSEACKNMWISLGIGVICVFMASILPEEPFFLSLFPFSMPFKILAGTEHAVIYIYASAAWIAVTSLAELVFIKIRRSLE